MMASGGLDIGSTGCKVTVYDEKGRYLYRTYREYPVSRNVGEHEVRAEDIWQGVCEVLKDAGARYPGLRAVGVTSFGESCVLLDREDRPIRPVMLYTDPRGSEECRELTKRLGKAYLEQITGVAPHSMYSMPKLMWIRKHCPEDYARAERILMMEDYILYLLTGQAVIDYSLAARSMAFDIRKLCWSREIFEAAKAQGKNTVALKASDGQAYREIFRNLIEEQKIFDYFGTYTADGEYKIAYSGNEEMGTISFWE